jgi:hypothetical protein
MDNHMLKSVEKERERNEREMPDLVRGVSEDRLATRKA